MRCVAAFAALNNHRESPPPVTTHWRLFAATAYADQNRQLAFHLMMVIAMSEMIRFGKRSQLPFDIIEPGDRLSHIGQRFARAISLARHASRYAWNPNLVADVPANTAFCKGSESGDVPDRVTRCAAWAATASS